MKFCDWEYETVKSKLPSGFEKKKNLQHNFRIDLAPYQP